MASKKKAPVPKKALAAAMVLDKIINAPLSCGHSTAEEIEEVKRILGPKRMAVDCLVAAVLRLKVDAQQMQQDAIEVSNFVNYVSKKDYKMNLDEAQAFRRIRGSIPLYMNNGDLPVRPRKDSDHGE
jgi:hypothetical protein